MFATDPQARKFIQHPSLCLQVHFPYIARAERTSNILVLVPKYIFLGSLGSERHLTCSSGSPSTFFIAPQAQRGLQHPRTRTQVRFPNVPRLEKDLNICPYRQVQFESLDSKRVLISLSGFRSTFSIGTQAQKGFLHPRQGP